MRGIIGGEGGKEGWIVGRFCENKIEKWGVVGKGVGRRGGQKKGKGSDE